MLDSLGDDEDLVKGARGRGFQADRLAPVLDGVERDARGRTTLVARVLLPNEYLGRSYYPGLASHPEHELARGQMAGFGGVVSFEIDGDMADTGRFIDGLRLPYIGPTLGGVESVVWQQAIFASSDPAELRKLGVADNLVRYALGIEDADDLIADLEQALDGI